MSVSFDPQALVARAPRVTRHRFTRRDTILYALGVGAGQEASPAEVDFVFERDLKALPTMAVALAYPGFWQMEPEYGIDWRRILHGEQSVTFERALPVEGEVRGEMTIDAIVDKGAAKGALMQSSRRIYDAESDALLATVRQLSFLRGDGGHGDAGGGIGALAPVPERPADLTVVAATRPEQALIYRLSGDLNPLHADPEAARQAGFDQPILHGLCTYGIAGRLLLHALCDGDPARMKRLDCRFTAPVTPGEALTLEVWRTSRDRAAFRVTAHQRQAIVINNGMLEYLDR